MVLDEPNAVAKISLAVMESEISSGSSGELVVLVDDAVVLVGDFVVVLVDDAVVLVGDFVVVLVDDAVVLVDDAVVLVDDAVVLVDDAVVLVDDAVVLVGDFVDVLVDDAVVLVGDFVDVLVDDAVVLVLEVSTPSIKDSSKCEKSKNLPKSGKMLVGLLMSALRKTKVIIIMAKMRNCFKFGFIFNIVLYN